MRVGESAINFECKLVKTHDIVNAAGKVTATVLFGEVSPPPPPPPRGCVDGRCVAVNASCSLIACLGRLGTPCRKCLPWGTHGAWVWSSSPPLWVALRLS